MRLFDLHCDWLWQYAPETTLFDPACYADAPARLPALDGYLLGASAAILFCSRAPDDWAGRADRWAALGDLIARYEAEFAGRLLIGPEDFGRCSTEPADHLCWGMMGIGGLDFLLREPGELERLAGAFERCVRVFQLVNGADNLLGGSDGLGDERSLTQLGIEVLERLLELAPRVGQGGARPVVDVAGMNAATLASVLDWFEHDGARSERLVLLSSCGPLGAFTPTPPDMMDSKVAVGDNLRRFRTLGGVIGVSPGPPAVTSAERLRETVEVIAAIPFMGRAGYEGIGIGTNFMRLPEIPPELAGAERLTDWVLNSFGSEVGSELCERTGRRLLQTAAGAQANT